MANPAGLNSLTALIIPLSSSSAGPKPLPPGGQPPPAGTVDPGYGIPESGLPKPEHPIYYPLPPGVPVDPEYGIPESGVPGIDNTLPGGPGVDNTLPGQPPVASTGPGFPTNPIVLPPGVAGGWEPVYIWGPGDPRPTVPIVIPPPGQMPESPIEWKAAWTPATGWIVIGVPSGPVATPSSAKRK